MKRLLILATILMLLSFNVRSFFGMIGHDVDIEKYREIGRQLEYNCAGRYSISETEEDYAVGVLISSQWVLTAASL